MIIEAGDIVICKEYVAFVDNSFHYEGQLIEVKEDEVAYFNSNSSLYDKPKHQEAHRKLLNKGR